eukprot:s3995_g8.t1
MSFIVVVANDLIATIVVAAGSRHLWFHPIALAVLLADFSFARSGCTLLGPLGSCTSLCLPFANFPVSPPGSEACRNTFGWWCDVFESQCQRVGGKFFEVGCGSKFLYCGHPLGFGVLDAMEVNGAGDQPQAGHQQAQPQAGQQNVQAAQFGHQQGQGSQVVPAEMVDRLAAEAQANVQKSDNLIKGLKLDVFKPSTREEELRTWKEWWFSFSTYVCAHDPAYESDFNEIDLDTEITHHFMDEQQTSRSQRLFGLLCSVLKGRPLLLIRSLEPTRCGFEAVRLLRREMEPREKARSLALMRQLAAWTFPATGSLHEHLVKYEDALRLYEEAAGQPFPKELVLATVVTGLRDPLKSQVQLRMTERTTYAEIREWVLQFESLNAPWSSSLPSGKGWGQGGAGGAQPMEVDMVKGKYGKNKGKDGKNKSKDQKGKAKDNKGKAKDGKGKDGKQWAWSGQGQGKGWAATWASPSWKQAWTSGGKDQQKAKPKGKGFGGGCAICGDLSHWKNECPKGKGRVNQIETQSMAGSAAASTTVSTSHSSVPSSASALRTQQQAYGVNLVSADGFQENLFDITEVGEEETNDYEAWPFGVRMVLAAIPEDSRPSAGGPQTFLLDATDGDDEWIFPSGPCFDLRPGAEERTEEVDMVRAVQRHSQVAVEVVVDSGADVSVAPVSLIHLGERTERANVPMQDAQGKRIYEIDTRILHVAVKTLRGPEVTIREKFSIARIGTVILSMGRLIRAGWELGGAGGWPLLRRGGHEVPIRLKRNTLTVPASISAIFAEDLPEPREVNMMTFDDVGTLPTELAAVAPRPGWHIMPSGLPVLVTHAVEELELERSLWSCDDWSWVAVFIKIDSSNGPPKEKDLWVQAVTMSTDNYEAAPKILTEIDPELTGRHDLIMVLHVDELPKDILSNPRDILREPEDGKVVEPNEQEPPNDAGGVGEIPDFHVGAGREVEEDEAPEVEELEGVRLEVATPLKDLRELCEKLGLARGGGKAKVLRRLRDHHMVLSRQLSTEVARKMYQEQERSPAVPKMPVMPSLRQQQIHGVTHHPFAAWCECCVLGRSKQSPHPKNKDVKVEEKTQHPKISIDYCYTFTKQRHEVQEGEEQAGAVGRAEEDAHDEAGDGAGAEQKDQPAQDDPADYRDQFGLTLLGAESTTGWVTAIPVLEKGATSLKRVVENLVRLSMVISPGEPVVIQGDSEPAIVQVINAVEACRAKLGLVTERRVVPKGSHASNGQVEKMIDVVRCNALTLRAYVEQRIKAAIEGHKHFYPWIMRHAGYLYNRYAVGPRGATAHELLYGRTFRGQLVPLGEQVIFHKPSRARGDLQWQRGVWLGVHERNGAHLLEHLMVSLRAGAFEGFPRMTSGVLRPSCQ